LSHAESTTALPSEGHLALTIGKNTIFGILATAVQVGTRFVMVPVVIYHLGLGGYGIWSIVMATAGYMRFGTAGVKSAFQKYAADAVGKRDFVTANKLLSTGSLSMLVLSVAGLVPMAIWSHRLAKAGGVPPEFLTAAAGSITLLAVIMVASNFGAVFEAIVMGGQRIDLTRTFVMVTTAGEAASIIALLHFGYGLFAMAATIAVSELVFVGCCFVASRRVVPEIRIRLRNVSRGVFRELVRYAGSYQLVNVLEVLYGLLLPVIIVKHFGAEMAGAYALVLRLMAAALMAQDALLPPLLSAGTLVFASGSAERIRRFFIKSFKTTMAVSLLPLAFLAAFGTLLVFAWTGETGPEFQEAIWLVCLSGLFQAISRLQLILYRASGKTLHDNVRQAFRLGVLGVLGYFGSTLGFYGVLGCLAAAEGIGVVYMFVAMSQELPDFSPRMLIPDNLRVTAATALVIAAGLLVAPLLIPWGHQGRAIALLKLGVVSLACLAAALPAVGLTGSLSPEEQRTALDVLAPWRKHVPATNA
jgi:O-antigen/teichoic acid export membrane protein